MTEPPENEADLAPAERDLATRLSMQRPVPAAGFRGALGRYLAVRDPRYGTRPGRLRPLVAAYATAGSLLIALGTLVSVGIL
jgi:hypothetical protein